jgi:chromosome partitioning protein
MQRLITHSPQFVCAVINRKGGVGKSMVATNIAAELALRGYNVGVVDVDSQGNAALYLGMQPEDGLFKALIGVQNNDLYDPLPLQDVIRVVPADSYAAPDVDEANQITGQAVTPGTLVLLPSYVNTFRIPYFLDDPDKFAELVSDMIQLYALDFVFIDTAPTMSMFDGAVYAATHGFLYVTEPEVGSLQGLQDAFTQVERLNKRRVKRGLPPSAVIGIVPNKKRALSEHNNNMRMLQENFSQLVFPTLRQLKTYPEANKYGMTVRAFQPRSPEAFEMLQVANRFEQAVAEYVYR